METRASHGYFVGDEAAQQARDGELATGAMPPDPNSVVVANGDTGELTHTFERAGDLLWAVTSSATTRPGWVGTIVVR